MASPNGPHPGSTRFVRLPNYSTYDSCMNSAMATDFALRTNSQLSVAAYRVWRTAFTSHQNATVFADQYHNAQLRYRFLTQMRLKLRDHLRSYKKARLVAVTLTKRRAFRGWIAKFQDAQRERKLLCFQDKCRNRYFDRG